MNEGKNIAIISCLTPIGLIIALILNNKRRNALTSFHIRQSFGILITSFAMIVIGGLVSIFPYVGKWIAVFAVFLGQIFTFILWVIGFVAAIKGEAKFVPVLGEYYQQLFETLHLHNSPHFMLDVFYGYKSIEYGVFCWIRL